MVNSAAHFLVLNCVNNTWEGGRNSKVVACLTAVNLADWLYTLKRHFPDADKFAARKFRCLGTMRYAALNVIVWERQPLQMLRWK